MSQFVNRIEQVAGIDRSSASHLTDRNAFWTCDDFTLRDNELEVAPLVVPFLDGLTYIGQETFQLSNEPNETVCLLGRDKALFADAALPEPLTDANVIRRKTFPAGSDSSRLLQLGIVSVESSNGFGTTNEVSVKITTIGTPDKVTVSVGGSPLGSYTNVNIPATLQLRVEVTAGNWVTFEFLQSTGHVLNTEWIFEQSKSFTYVGTKNDFDRWVYDREGSLTYLVRGGVALVRENNCYRQMFCSAMSTQGYHNARYVAIFQQHLFIAGNDYVAWSDARRYNHFLFDLNNDADKKTLQQNRLVDPDQAFVTGLFVLGSRLYVLQNDKILFGTYVGRPDIMNFDVAEPSVGNEFLYSACLAGSAIALADYESFYLFDGGQINDIGAKVASLWQEDLSKDKVFQRNVHSFYNARSGEILWFYPSVESTYGEIDKKLVYNIKSNTWVRHNVVNVKSCFDGYVSSQLTALQGSNTPSSGELLYYNPAQGVGRDARSDEAPTAYWLANEPVLETADIIYEDYRTLSHVQELLADFTNEGGITLQYSNREKVDAPIVYSAPKTLLPTDPKKNMHIDQKGKIWRFRLSFAPTQGRVLRSKLRAWGELVNIRVGEK